MANISDPPVNIPPVKGNKLVITAGAGTREQTLTVETKGKKLKLIVTRGETRFETPIDEGQWKLEIVEVT